MNTEILDNLSIERFAAFLDGNLNEEDMQEVAAAIDSSNEFTDILSEVMQVDECVDLYTSQPDMLQSESLDIDFDLPVIPVFSESPEEMELSVVNSDNSTIELRQNDDIQLSIAADQIEPTATVQNVVDQMQASGYDDMPCVQSDEEIMIDDQF